MTLSREEIRRDVAVRMACALIARDGYDDEGAPRDAVTLADALLAALTLTPAPCPPPVAGSAEKDEALRRAAERILDSASRLSRSARPLGVGGCGHSVHSGVLGEVESDIDDLRSALSRPVRP